MPSMLGALMVATTVPMTRASCIATPPRRRRPSRAANRGAASSSARISRWSCGITRAMGERAPGTEPADPSAIRSTAIATAASTSDTAPSNRR